MASTFRMRWSCRDRDGPALGVRFELVAGGALVTPDGVRDATGVLLAPFQLWTGSTPELIDAPRFGARPAALMLAPDRLRQAPPVDPLGALDRLIDRARPGLRASSSARLHDCLELVRRHLLQFAAPGPRREAARWSRWLGWFLYPRLVADDSGRLLQAARCAPGLVGLLLSLEAVDLGKVAALGWRGIEAGEPVAPLLAAVLRAPYADDPALLGPITAVEGEALEAWLRGGAPPPARVALHRLLLRRAPATLPPFLYSEPPPEGLWPEALPRGARAFAGYESRLQVHARILRDAEPLPRTAGAGLAAFLSAHPRIAVPEQACAAWHSAGGRVTKTTRPRTLLRALGHVAAVERSRPAPGLPRPGFRQDGDWLKPLAGEVEALAEGVFQRNCLAHTPADARSTLYRGVLAGQRVTVELRPTADGPRLGDARGPANVPVREGVLTALRRWAETGVFAR